MTILHAGRRALSAAVLCLPLAGCVSTAGPGTVPPMATATNAPVAAGINVQPGSEEDFVVNVGRRTFFKEGSAELDDTARVTLDKQAAWLQQYPVWKVKVQGFADDPGDPAQNLSLSRRRADAASAYLVTRGVAQSRLLAKGYGRDAERLITNCNDVSCRAQNRRVISNIQEEFEP